jgi:plastocyanin
MKSFAALVRASRASQGIEASDAKSKETEMKTSTSLLVIAFIAGGMVAAVAAEQTVSQKGKVFSPTTVTIKKGDTLVFSNDDNVAHNIYSVSPNNEFNLGSQAPGNSTPITFDKSGDIDIVCAIHPVMKMKVKVTD